MSAQAPIFITGLGVVSALGCHTDPFIQSLKNGERSAQPVDRNGGWHGRHSSRLAAFVTENERSWRPSGIAMRRFSRPSRFAVAAAVQAISGATDFQKPAVDDPHLGISMSTFFGPSLFTQNIMDQTLNSGPAAVSPSLFTECVANAAAAQVSLALRARGPQLTMLSREAGPASAVIQAVNILRHGQARRMLAGTAEEMTPFVHAQLDRFRSLARPVGDLAEAARPFDRRRNGLLAAEGAGIILMEAPSASGSGGTRPLAKVIGGRMAFDPTSTPSGWGTGSEALADALSGLLEQSQLGPEGIDLIVSGAAGSRQGDRLEAEILHRVWRHASLPPVLAPKAQTGDFGGGFLAAAILAAAGKYRGQPAGDFQMDPELRMPVLQGTLSTAPRRTLITAPASGGPYGWLILENPDL